MTEDEMLSVVKAILSDITRRDCTNVRLDDSFADDLQIDGDDISFLLPPRVQKAFDIRVRVPDWESVGTVRDLVRLVESYRNVR